MNFDAISKNVKISEIGPVEPELWEIREINVVLLVDHAGWKNHFIPLAMRDEMVFSWFFHHTCWCINACCEKVEHSNCLMWKSYIYFLADTSTTLDMLISTIQHSPMREILIFALQINSKENYEWQSCVENRNLWLNKTERAFSTTTIPAKAALINTAWLAMEMHAELISPKFT